MSEKIKLALLGGGKLSGIIAQAVKDGLLDDYELVGVYSRSPSSAQRLAERTGCKACASIEELLALKPEYVAEAASPQAVRDHAEKILAGGANLVVLSIGAFADQDFFERVKMAAVAAKRRVHLASGAIGGFDVLRTTSLMGGVEAQVVTHKGPESLRGTPVFTEELLEKEAQVFHGTAKEAIALFPTKVNVTVAAALATAGPENTMVTICSVPGFVGDDHRIQVRGAEVDAVADIYSKTSAIAGWSVVALLQNIVSPIVFQ